MRNCWIPIYILQEVTEIISGIEWKIRQETKLNDGKYILRFQKQYIPFRLNNAYIKTSYLRFDNTESVMKS